VPYDITLPLMIRDWRKRWGEEFAFEFVQLANFKPVATEPGNNDPWPLLQDRMRRVLDTMPNTGMAVINDVGAADDIHPKDKKTPGDRLAIWALAKTYGKEVVHSGPLFASSQKDSNAITVQFSSVGSGLKSRDGGPLKRFEVAGDDRVWHWADAEIVGKSAVKVSCRDVSAPIAVRYAWAANPEGANLVNSEGLPTSVFRTDDWDDVVSAQDEKAAKNAAEIRKLGTEIKAMRSKRDAMEKGSDAHRKLFKEMQQKTMRLKTLQGR
jgi:sialate O-acetylesterase